MRSSILKILICILFVIFMMQNRLYSKSYKEFDYFNYSYRYLNKDFSLKIDDKVFNKTVELFQFYPERIVSYKDSLCVALMAEFGDWNYVRVGVLRIAYSWQRLGYHLWMSSEDAMNFSAEFKIEHPFIMKKFLEDENNHNPQVLKLFKSLKEKLKNICEEVDYSKMNRKDLLTKAMILNPQRQKEFLKYNSKNGIDRGDTIVGCGRLNCCQNKK